MVKIEPDCPAEALEIEWLLTNRAGGYAMGTVAGINTRRYHGLLTAALHQPVQRLLVLHSLVEELVVCKDDGTESVYPLSTQQFRSPEGPAVLHPEGHKYLTWFRAIPPHQVEWTWKIDEMELTRHVRFSFGQGNHCRISYAISAGDKFKPSGCGMRVRPLLAMRSHHALDSLPHKSPEVECSDDQIVIRSDRVAVQFKGRSIGANFHHDEQWWEDFEYTVDGQRGQGTHEDIWSPGIVSASLNRRKNSFGFWVGVIDPAVELIKDEGFNPNVNDDVGGRVLRQASRQFVVHRGSQGRDRPPTIIAGYPWFSDWGRDAMISMPGIMLCNGQWTEAEHMLLSFAQHMRNGLIPNRFDDNTAEAEYNTVDASLWFVYAAFQLWREVDASNRKTPHLTSPLKGGRELAHACRAIIAAYRNGTDYKIYMETDGLIAAGDETTQLTWMDAKRNGVVFTPRHGKAVEINALWFNALHCLAAMTDDAAERDELIVLAARVGESIRSQFWWGQRGCLHDVLKPIESQSGKQGSTRDAEYTPDGKLRPNQIFAVALTHSPLERDQQRAVVDVVTEKFLTPFGLRTLDRGDPDYRPRYEGDMMQRDAAYHNGTVWPWLIGPYCDAVLRVNEFSDEAKQTCLAVTQPLVNSMQSGCLGQIAEIYDGDPPHRPDGCPAQAWSVAEVLRIRTLAGGVD